MNRKILPELPHDIYKVAQLAERKELELEQLEEVALEYEDKRQGTDSFADIGRHSNSKMQS